MTVEQTPFVDTYQPAPTRGTSWRFTLISAVLMLLAGGVVGSWVAWHYAEAPSVVAPTPAGVADLAPTAYPGAVRPAPIAAPAVAQPARPLTETEAGTMAVRVAMLEERLSRIALSADSASGNAAKAEALLIALAARRALERGLPLGILDSQLRIRFGETQPRAVESIIAAGTNPMTEAMLAARLETLQARLRVPADAGLFDRVSAALDTLIVIHANDQPSPATPSRYQRARAALAQGRIDLAIAEIESTPGASDPAVADWLNSARLRNDAGRALDLIESAAILAPAGHVEPRANAAPPPAEAATAPRR